MELANGKQNKFFTVKAEVENKYYIEDFNAEEAKGLSNVYILSKEVPENSIVLDVGCGQGKFGKILKEKKCTLYGIDLDQKAIEYAKNSGYYDKVFIMDVTNKNFDKYKEFISTVKQVDVIIMSDILEHVSDPTELLLEYSKLLKENGFILISVPNITHIDILLNLMNDKFNYQDMGILDNTHLKFFTKSSFVDWINQINETFDNITFDCEYLGATFYNNQFLNTIKKEYNELFTILENSFNYNGLQILFRLTKLSEGRKPIHLKSLQEEYKVDVIEILGNALKGKINNVQNHKVVEGERLWYEKTLAWYANHTKELEKTINCYSESEKIIKESLSWHIDKVKELERTINCYSESEKIIKESLNWHIDKVKELEKTIDCYYESEKIIKESLNWHIDRVKELENVIEKYRENEKDTQTNMIQKENEFEMQRNKNMEEMLELRKKIFEMENSRSWKLTKFLRKDG